MMVALRRTMALLAWAGLAAIVFSTLSPIGMRPHLGPSVHLERFGAVALVGFLFAFAHPRRVGVVLACVASVIVGLELLQLLASGRHARLSDLAVKIAGGVFGVAFAWLVSRWRARPGGRVNRNASSLP